MAIGDPITQTIPAVSTLGTGYATQINAFLTEVKLRLEAQVSLPSLLASGPLDLAGQPLKNAQYTSYSEQSSVPSGSPVGRWEYYAGEFYAVTPAGVVQITQGGALSVTSAGGFSGNYGGANPASARFIDASQTYEFYDDFAGLAWAYVRALGFEVMGGSTSTNRVRIKWAGSVNYDLSLPVALPASNQSVLVVDSTGQVEDNDTTNRITNDVVLGTSGTKIRHGEYTIKQPLSINDVIDPSVSLTSTGVLLGVVANGGVGTSTTFRVAIRAFQNHWRLKSIQLDYDGTEAGTRSIRAYQVSGINTGGAISQAFIETAATSSGTVGPLVKTLATPFTGSSATSVLCVEVVARNADKLWQLRFVYDTDY